MPSQLGPVPAVSPPPAPPPAERRGACGDDTASRRHPGLRGSGELADDRYEEFDRDEAPLGDAPVDEPIREERPDEGAPAIDEPGGEPADGAP